MSLPAGDGAMALGQASGVIRLHQNPGFPILKKYICRSVGSK